MMIYNTKVAQKHKDHFIVRAGCADARTGEEYIEIEMIEHPYVLQVYEFGKERFFHTDVVHAVGYRVEIDMSCYYDLKSFSNMLFNR